MPSSFPPASERIAIRYEAVAYEDIEGWQSDDTLTAFETFLRSCGPILKRALAPAPLLEVCRNTLEMKEKPNSVTGARVFFESHFQPHRIVDSTIPGLLTGYYEPVLEASRRQEGRYQIPILRRPADLVNLVDESERGAVGQAFTHMRKTAAGLEIYPTRADIEAGALAGQGLEIFWLTDAVEAFMMHVQGSGCLRLPDGTTTRITYDGKNGHPYTSIGRYLIETQQFPADRMSLEAMKDWLKADPLRGRKAMQQNKSYIFFRELTGADAQNPLGVMEIPLTPGRSLAVDTGYHAIGSPVWVSSPSLTHAMGSRGFRRLMIAQDVGSAIKGPERGDIYFGTGDEAGRLAGMTKHTGMFLVFLPGGATPTVT
jgi:membrane-bound lytic murein transglycosylase A